MEQILGFGPKPSVKADPPSVGRLLLFGESIENPIFSRDQRNGAILRAILHFYF